MKLLDRVKDTITGFTGMVTATTEYVSGCNQALVQPPVKADGEFVEGHWIDQQRLEVVDEAAIAPLDNSKTPGPDVPAPVR